MDKTKKAPNEPQNNLNSAQDIQSVADSVQPMPKTKQPEFVRGTIEPALKK